MSNWVLDSELSTCFYNALCQVLKDQVTCTYAITPYIECVYCRNALSCDSLH